MNSKVEEKLAVNVDQAWAPSYSPWRHGGWYVHSNRYPDGTVGCVRETLINGPTSEVAGEMASNFLDDEANRRSIQ
ncbi:hypothetical protein ACXIVK_00005 [Paraburkholderia caledonica]